MSGLALSAPDAASETARFQASVFSEIWGFGVIVSAVIRGHGVEVALAAAAVLVVAVLIAAVKRWRRRRLENQDDDRD